MLTESLYLLLSLGLGSIPCAWLLGRLRGVDLRAQGSGNPGATNLARALGLPWGVAGLLGDAGKGIAAVLLGHLLFTAPHEWLLPILGGAAAVVGHCFSPFLGFRGGKGVATAAGMLAALEPILCLGLVIVWLVLLGILRNVGVASSLTAIVAAAVSAYRWSAAGERRDLEVVSVFVFCISLLIVFRHRANLGEYFRAAGSARPSK